MFQLKPFIQTKQSKELNRLPFFQPKLKVGQPGDKYEREADAVADRVMRMGESESLRMQPIEEEEEMMQPKIQMQVEEEEEPIQMKCEKCLQEEMIQQQPIEEEEQMIQREIIQKEDKLDKKLKTTVKVVGEHDFLGKETKAKATVKSESSTEQKISDSLSSKTTASKSFEEESGSAELKVKNKRTGLSGTAGIKAKSPASPANAATAIFYAKVGGKWTPFKYDVANITLGGSFKVSSVESPAIALNGKAVFLPNGKIKPEIVANILLENGLISGSLTPGLTYQITDILSANAGVTVGVDSKGNLSAKMGAGLMLEF